MTLAGLLELIWLRRWAFLTAFVVALVAVVAWAFLATPTYRVAAKVMPRQGDNPVAGVQSLLSQFSGIAALAGIGLGVSVDEQEAIAWLKSRAFAERFIERHNLMPVLFADAWDSAAGRWQEAIEKPPTMDNAWFVFDRRIRRVNQDTKTKLVTLEIAWTDRKRAASWANELVAQANAELRARALREADESIASLEKQLRQTDAVELRQSIFRLMEAQINRKILAQSRPDYAFATIDPAVVPDEDNFASPRRRLLVLIAIPFAAFVGAGVVLGLHLATSLASILGLRRTPPPA